MTPEASIISLYPFTIPWLPASSGKSEVLFVTWERTVLIRRSSPLHHAGPSFQRSRSALLFINCLFATAPPCPPPWHPSLATARALPLADAHFTVVLFTALFVGVTLFRTTDHDYGLWKGVHGRSSGRDSSIHI